VARKLLCGLMNYRRCSLSICATGLLLGCIERAPLEPGETGVGETEDSGGSETGAATDLPPGDPTATDADPDPDTDSDPPGDDTGVDSDEPPGDDDGDEKPAECATTDPAAQADFELALAGLDPEAWYDFDALCVVDAVAVEGDSVVTGLTCTIDGAPTPAVLTLPVAPEGAVAWSPGKQVHVLAYSNFDFEVGTGWHRKVEVRVAGSEELLLLALEDDDESMGKQIPPSWLAPLTVEVVLACGPEGEPESGFSTPMALEFRDPADNALELFSGHRGALPIDPEQSYAIDVEDATTGHCCHFSRRYQLIVRRAVTVAWWPN
jgi:hypothetical protein